MNDIYNLNGILIDNGNIVAEDVLTEMESKFPD